MKRKTPNLKITISGTCSGPKLEIAEKIAKALKEFGSIKITGDDYLCDFYDGFSCDESIEINVIPNKKTKEDIENWRLGKLIKLDKVVK